MTPARRAVIAPDKFKGSLSAVEAAGAIDRGLHVAFGDLDSRIVPMADGGEGTVDAFVATGWRRIVHSVRGPLGARVDAAFAMEGSRAIVEMSAGSGLALLEPDAYDPSHTTTYGAGELVRAALDAGATHIVIGIGGSATNDAGAGFLAALGAHIVDADGRELPPGGRQLARAATIDLARLDSRLRSVRFDVASDVDNPLLGERGATAIFGPQKGATEDDLRALEGALSHFADVSATTLGVDRRGEPGTGAAGGLGFALRAFVGAALRPGVEIVAELRGLARELAGAAWCFTGEGSIDAQTLSGKTVDGVARLARSQGVPTIAFGGRVSRAAEHALAERGVTVVPIVDGPATSDDAMQRAAELLERAAARVGRLLQSGSRTDAGHISTG